MEAKYFWQNCKYKKNNSINKIILGMAQNTSSNRLSFFSTLFNADTYHSGTFTQRYLYCHWEFLSLLIERR